MRNLLRADGRRLWRSTLYRVFCLLTVCYGAAACVLYYRNSRGYEGIGRLDDVLFYSFSMIGVGLAVVLSVHVGTEFSDGTIRNKLVVGRRRSEVYLAGAMTCLWGAFLAAAVSVAVNAAVGGVLLGGLQRGAAFTAERAAVCLFAAAAYVSFFYMVVMLSADRTCASVCNILCGFGVLFLGIYLYARLGEPAEIVGYELTVSGGDMLPVTEPNPGYVSGGKREVFQFVLDLFPGGQVLQMLNCDMPHPVRMCLCSLAVTVCCNAAGLLAFGKKDLK